MKPAVALETAVITHGLPPPHNLEAGKRICQAVSQAGATPVIVGVLQGKPFLQTDFGDGWEHSEVGRLASHPNPVKVALYNLGLVQAQGLSGGTTVSATLWLAHQAGITCMATGGIGGVHRGGLPDVSADLPTLARLPMLVVCSGAKIILDLPATREWLETWGIPVVGYQTDELPGFYTAHTGLRVDAVADSVEEVVALWQAHLQTSVGSSMLVVQPPPAEYALNPDEISAYLQQALLEAETQGIRGSALTPWLLRRLGELSDGRTLAVNLALLEANAFLAGRIATALKSLHAV